MLTNTTRRERGQDIGQIIYIHIHVEKKNTRWVTVLPIWRGLCLLCEGKGQRYIKQYHLPQVKTALLEVTFLACLDRSVTGYQVCCTLHCGSTAMLAMTTAADSFVGPCHWHFLQSIGTVCTTTPAKKGYFVTSLSATGTK